MATSWCPQCRAEYIEGIVTCVECGVALVPDEPAQPDRHAYRHHHHEGAARPDDPGDELVEVATVGALEAELLAGRLREDGIDAVVFGSGLSGYLGAANALGGSSRVMVRRGDAERAAVLLNA